MQQQQHEKVAKESKKFLRAPTEKKEKLPVQTKYNCVAGRQGPSFQELHPLIEPFLTRDECIVECNNMPECMRFDYVATDPAAKCRLFPSSEESGSYRESNDRELCTIVGNKPKIQSVHNMDDEDQVNEAEEQLTEEQVSAAAKELGGELKLIGVYVEEAISNKMGSSKNGKVSLKKNDDYMNTVLKGFGKHGVRCLRRLDLMQNMLGVSTTRILSDDILSTYYSPSIYTQNVLDSYRSNNRKWYRQVGENLKLKKFDSEGEEKNKNENENDKKKEEVLVANMLLEPYDQTKSKREPVPALCVFENAAVDTVGNVCTSTNKCLQAKTCSSAYGQYPKNGKLIYDVVYSIAEFWGEGFFHFLCENFVRLFIGLDWLKSPGRGMAAMIHVKKKTSFAMQALAAVGVSSSRVLSGVSAKAKAMIIPEPVGCGSPGKILAQLTRVSVLSNVLSFKQLSSTIPTKLKLTVISRGTGSRSVVNHQKLVAALKMKYEVEGGGGHTVQVFTKLSMKDSVKLFKTTDIVLGPHGAGLSNILYMQPGRGVVEFMVAGKDVNACYMYLAVKLGLRYHTWSDPKSTQNGKMTVDVENILLIVSGMMEEMK